MIGAQKEREYEATEPDVAEQILALEQRIAWDNTFGTSYEDMERYNT